MSCLNVILKQRNYYYYYYLLVINHINVSILMNENYLNITNLHESISKEAVLISIINFFQFKSD